MSNGEPAEPAGAAAQQPAARQEPKTRWWAAEVEPVYQAHRQPLHQYVRNQARVRGLPESALDTEGVVQEAFASLMKCWPEVKDPPAWLCTVARNLINKAQREFRQVAPTPDPTHDRDSAGSRWTSTAPRASDEDIVLARTVMRDIARLSDRQAVAAYLRHVQGWSAEEIGEYLNCAPATARVHAHRGTHVLRERLTGFLRDRNLTAPQWSDGLAAAALAALIWILLAVLLRWLGLPVPLAVLGPAVPAIAAAGWWAVRILRRRRSAHRPPGPDRPS